MVATAAGTSAATTTAAAPSVYFRLATTRRRLGINAGRPTFSITWAAAGIAAFRNVSGSFVTREPNRKSGRCPRIIATDAAFTQAAGALGTTFLLVVMGWGISVAVRNEVIGPGLQYAVALPDVSVLLVDGPAMTRSGAVGTRPATTIVRSIINTAPATVTEIVVLFDCPTKIPAARAAVHVRRAAASQTVFAPEALRLMTATSLNGATWQELFSTAAGKARAYNLLFDAFKVETIAASATATADVRTTLTDPETNAVWSHPYDGTRSAMADDIELYDYGEAECQLAMCIRGLAARSPEIRAAVLTIDTDIYLQTALSPVIDTSQIVIAAARVWRNDTTVVRVASAGRKRARAEQLTQMWELVTCDALLPAATPAGLFLHLCAGGVDYCKGLGGYGWPQSNLVAAGGKGRRQPPRLPRPSPAGRWTSKRWRRRLNRLGKQPGARPTLASCASSWTTLCTAGDTTCGRTPDGQMLPGR